MYDPFVSRQLNLNPKALLAFEKVAHRGSIIKASEDLNVAASAISRYIKLLEQELGISLFHRQNGKLTLNENGKFFYNEVHQALNRIRSSSWRVAKKGANHIKVWCYPVVASEWLLPRIEGFYTESSPRISVITGLTPPADTLQYCDVAILSKESLLPNYASSFFYTEKLVPVCTPQYLATGKYGNGRYSSLAISTTRVRELEAWNMRHQNLLETANELEFDQSALAVSAARTGLGIALAADVWVANDLVSGSLVLPYGDRWVRGVDHYIAYGENSGTTIVQLFKEWMIEEMEACQSGLDKVYAEHALKAS